MQTPRVRSSSGESSKMSKEERIAAYVRFHLDQITANLSPRRSQWGLFTRQYKAMVKHSVKKHPWFGCSNIFVPELANGIISISSFILDTEFRTSPVFKIKNFYNEDSEVAQELEHFADFYLKSIQELPSYWRRHLPYLVLLGTHIQKQVLMKDKITGWDLIKPVCVPLVQFYTYDSVLELKNSPFVGDVQYTPFWDVYSKLNELRNHPDTQYVIDGKDLNTILERYNKQVPTVNAEKSKAGFDPPRTPAGFMPFINGYMMFVDEDSNEAEKIHVGYDRATHTLLYWSPYEEWELPYIPHFWRRDEDNFFGIGIGDLGWRIQDGINTTFNQAIDNSSIANAKVFKKRRGAAIDPEVGLYPGAHIDVNDNEDLTAMDMGTLNGSELAVVQSLKEALNDTMFTPESLMGQPDTTAKSGISPGVVHSNVSRASARLDFFVGEFEEGLLSSFWYSLASLSKLNAAKSLLIPKVESNKTLFEWLKDSSGNFDLDEGNEMTPNEEQSSLTSLVAARVEKPLVSKVIDFAFRDGIATISRARFEIKPRRKEYDPQMEQQASMLLSQLVNGYVTRIVQFAQLLQQLQQQGGTENLVQSLFEAWKATNITMRRVLSAFAVEEASDILIKLEGVVNGLEAGLGELGNLPGERNPINPAQPRVVPGGTPQEFSGGASGIEGGRPVLESGNEQTIEETL